MPASRSILEVHSELADQINAEALANPKSPYLGKFVGMANGQVVVASDDLDEAIRLLRLVDPNPQKTFCFEAGVDYSEVQYIWEFC